jgi:hypothetical protein
MLVPTLLCLFLAQHPDASPAASDGAPPAASTGVARGASKGSDAAWTLDYEIGPMRLFRDEATGEAYWYATFTIVNRSDKDRHIAPRWEMLDEQGRVFVEGRGVPSDVTKAILKLLNDPQLQESSAVVGDIARGAENGKPGVVVFPVGPEVRRFSLLVSGLSSERDALKDPKSGKPITVQKTLRVDYQIPGERSGLRGAVPLAEPESGSSNPSWIYR